MMEEKNKKPLVFTDKRTEDKIDSHLTNINDEITEADIANVQTDVTPNTAKQETKAEIEAAATLARKEDQETLRKGDHGNSAEVDTTWNVIDDN